MSADVDTRRVVFDRLRAWADGPTADTDMNGVARDVRAVLRLIPPADLPATLASVDDVRRVCEAAGLGGYMRSGVGISTWGVGTTLIVRFVSVSAGQFRVEVERSADERVATLYPDSLATLLWHAITAARSAS